MARGTASAELAIAQQVRPFASLAYRDFRYLWLGVVAMMAGLQIQAVVQGYYTYDLTSSPLRLGLVNAGFAFPMLALSLFGGAIADRVEKRRIIQLSQALGSATAIAIGVSVTTGTVTWVHLPASSVVNGIIFAFLVPARTALIPKLVDESLVSNALALTAAAMSGTTIIAPAIGGGLYALIGPEGLYYSIAALELSAVLLTGLIRTRDERAAPPSEGLRRRILGGFAYIGRTPPLLTLLVMGLATSLLVAPFRSLLPVLIVEEFHRGPETLGILLRAMGVGAIAASLTIAALGRRRRGTILIAGGLLSAAALTTAAAFPFFLVTLVVMVVLGVSDSIRQSLTMALILEYTHADFQGRVSSVYTMNFGLMPLGTLPAAAVAARHRAPTSTLILVVLLFCVCAAVLAIRPLLRRSQ